MNFGLTIIVGNCPKQDFRFLLVYDNKKGSSKS